MPLQYLEARESMAWARALLRIPLVAKVAGANVLIVVIAFVAALLLRQVSTSAGALDARLILLVALALSAGFLINLALVFLALRPLQALEAAATSVARGNFDARVKASALADRDIAQVGATINLLLDGLAADRLRTRQLAADVIEAGDRERAYIARELHDSVAQTLAALVMQVGAAARDCQVAELASRLATIKELGADSLEEVRSLAHTMQPRVLDDLGLPAALAYLAREAETLGHAHIDVSVADDFDQNALAESAAAVLYRVAQESIGNAVRHSRATHIRVSLVLEDRSTTLRVADDGDGFDVAEAYARRPGMGLFTMRERVALVSGKFEIRSASAGTTVEATVPLGPLP